MHVLAEPLLSIEFLGRRDFSDEAEVSPMLKEHVWNELAPLVGATPITGSEKYEAAAKVAEWQGMESRHVADLLLRAAWCCVDEGDIEAERFFRRKASWKFEESLASYDGVPRDESRLNLARGAISEANFITRFEIRISASITMAKTAALIPKNTASTKPRSA